MVKRVVANDQLRVRFSHPAPEIKKYLTLCEIQCIINISNKQRVLVNSQRHMLWLLVNWEKCRLGHVKNILGNRRRLTNQIQSRFKNGNLDFTPKNSESQNLFREKRQKCFLRYRDIRRNASLLHTVLNQYNGSISAFQAEGVGSNPSFCTKQFKWR